MVRVVQPGKERNQGVGYLADGTMIVVEDGDKLMGQEVQTEVTRVFQTVAGKMIFATPRKTGQPQGPHKPLTDPTTHPTAPAQQDTKNTTPAPAESAEKNARKNRFGRGRSRGGNGPKNQSGNQPGAQTPASQSAEDRIIAATGERSSNVQ
jgi:hypothetical protein